MLKKLSVLLIAALAMGTAAYAEDATITATDEPRPLVAEQHEVESATSSACDTEAPLFVQPIFAAAAGDGGGNRATCTATCRNGSTVSCTGSSCTGADANCPSHKGFVRCDGVTTWCSAACPPSNCPNTPGCNYVFNKFTACCVSSTCPMICQ